MEFFGTVLAGKPGAASRGRFRRQLWFIRSTLYINVELAGNLRAPTSHKAIANSNDELQVEVFELRNWLAPRTSILENDSVIGVGPERHSTSNTCFRRHSILQE